MLEDTKQAVLEMNSLLDNAGIVTKRLKLLQNALAMKDEAAAPVVKKVYKPVKASTWTPAAEADALHGLYPVVRDGSPCVVE